VPNRPRFHGKVLLVEDNLTNQEVTRGLLQVFGCQVEVANHGREALEKWAERDFDLILMDCQMPVMDGLTASRELRSGRSRRVGCPPPSSPSPPIPSPRTGSAAWPPA